MPMKFETNIRQDPAEFEDFLRLLKKENIKSFLEIGSKHGGSWWRISNLLPIGARTVSVDLPHGDGSFKESEPHLKECCRHLKKRGYDAHLFLGDSTDKSIIASVQALGPFDLVFIDANHTEPFVRSDWEHYGSLGRIVAFHDIGWVARPEPSKKMPIHVPMIWKELKEKHPEWRNHEIRKCPRDNGIGILWINLPKSLLA